MIEVVVLGTDDIYFGLQLYRCQSSFVRDFVVVSVNPYPWPMHNSRFIEAFDI